MRACKNEFLLLVAIFYPFTQQIDEREKGTRRD